MGGGEEMASSPAPPAPPAVGRALGHRFTACTTCTTCTTRRAKGGGVVHLVSLAHPLLIPSIYSHIVYTHYTPFITAGVWEVHQTDQVNRPESEVLVTHLSEILSRDAAASDRAAGAATPSATLPKTSSADIAAPEVKTSSADTSLAARHFPTPAGAPSACSVCGCCLWWLDRNGGWLCAGCSQPDNRWSIVALAEAVVVGGSLGWEPRGRTGEWREVGTEALVGTGRRVFVHRDYRPTLADLDTAGPVDPERFFDRANPPATGELRQLGGHRP